MPVFTETLTVYRPTQIVSSTDLSVLPSEVALVGTIAGNLHRGTTAAREATNNLGIISNLPGLLYTGIENAEKVGDRYVIADERGQLWVVHGLPSVRNRFPVTAHVKAVVTLLRVKPAGVP